MKGSSFLFLTKEKKRKDEVDKPENEVPGQDSLTDKKIYSSYECK